MFARDILLFGIFILFNISFGIVDISISNGKLCPIPVWVNS